MKIEITVPVLNEELTLRDKIFELNNYIISNLYDLGDVSIIIADNGSDDDTNSISMYLAEQFNNVKYIRLKERGVGRALKASWTNSNADVVGYMDLDLATDLKHLKPALDALINGKFELVTGSRLKSGSEVIGRSVLRNVTSYIFNKLVKITFNTSFTDGMCGFKFVKRDSVKKLISSGASSDGWFFATEILVVGEHLNLPILDLPVKWVDDPNSKVNVIKLSIEYVKQIIRLKKLLNNKSL